MAGVIATRSSSLAEQLYYIINSTGCGLSPFDCWLLSRGLKTLAIRVENNNKTVLELPNF